MNNYEDLRAAIEQTVLVKDHGEIRIIRFENSGIRDPWIFDFRALMLQAKWLNRYAEIFWEKYGDKRPFQVGGLETAGIPLVAAIVMKGVERGTPVNGFYVRKSRKRQGLMKNIEGTLTKDPVILVDDLANSGQSVFKQIKVLEDVGVKVTDVFVMLAFRSVGAYSFFEKNGIRFDYLFKMTDFGLPVLAPHSAETPRDDFEILWRYQAPNPSLDVVVQKSNPIVDDRNIFFGCDDGKFRCISQKTGEIVWEFKIGRHPDGKAILSTPKIHGDYIYFGAYDGNFYALEKSSGKKVWEYEHADWIGSSPDIAPDLGFIYVGLEFGLFRKQGGIAALDLKTGKEIWRAEHAGTTHGSPLYIKVENLVVIGSNDGIVYAYEAKSGSLKWMYAIGNHIKHRPAYDVAAGEIIVTAMNGKVVGLSATGTPNHGYEAGIAIYSTPLVYKNNIYVATIDKHLVALDNASWRKKWHYEANGRFFSSPIEHGGSIWIGSNSGKLCEFDPETGKLKSSFQASERIVNAPAFAGDKIFVPTVANEIYCITRKSNAGPITSS